MNVKAHMALPSVPGAAEAGKKAGSQFMTGFQEAEDVNAHVNLQQIAGQDAEGAGRRAGQKVAKGVSDGCSPAPPPRPGCRNLSMMRRAG